MDNFLKEQLNSFSISPAESTSKSKVSKGSSDVVRNEYEYASSIPQVGFQTPARWAVGGQPQPRFEPARSNSVGVGNQGRFYNPIPQEQVGYGQHFPNVVPYAYGATTAANPPSVAMSSGGPRFIPTVSAMMSQDQKIGYQSVPNVTSYGHPASFSEMQKPISSLQQFGPQQVTENFGEDRKKLQAQRQQQKMKQSFQASRNKVVDPDVLLNKIVADFKPVNSISAKPLSSSSPPVVSPDQENIKTVMQPPVVALPRESITILDSPQAPKPPDITDLMNRFTDLSAPMSQPRVFSAVSKTVVASVITKKVASFSDSQTARDWKTIPDDLTAVFSSVDKEPQTNMTPTSQVDLPPWCYDIRTLPPVYYSVLSIFPPQTPISKETVFNILLQSGLSKSTLSQIWSTTSRSKPGFLLRAELCAALALTGLAQSNFDVQHLTIEVLRRIPGPPVPQFIASPQQEQPVQLQQHVSVNPQRFEDIPLRLPVSLASSIPSPVKNVEEDEFSDFVSAPAPVPENKRTYDPQSKPPMPVLPLSTADSLPKAPAPICRTSHSKSFEWNEWSDATISVPSTQPSVGLKLTNDLPSIEVVSKMAHNRQRSDFNDIQPLPISKSGSDIINTAQLDRYAALRDVIPPPAQTPTSALDPSSSSSEIISTDDWSADLSFPEQIAATDDRSLMDAALWITSPSSDNLSVNSLDLGGPNMQLDLDTTSFGDNHRPSPNSSLFLADVEPDLTTNEAAGSYHREEVWERSLHACSRLLRETGAVFNSASDSKTLEVVLGKSSVHISDLTEIYGVAKRIGYGLASLELGEIATIKNLMQDVEAAWSDLVAVLSTCGLEVMGGMSTICRDLFEAYLSFCYSRSADRLTSGQNHWEDGLETDRRVEFVCRKRLITVWYEGTKLTQRL